jgi:PadR family transcriptional regulator PadR
VDETMPQEANQEKLTRHKKAFAASWVLEMCVLAFLFHDDAYGYRIAKSIDLQVSESTLYPILRKLESDGYLEMYAQQHNARLRQFYKITPKGMKQLEELKKSWRALVGNVEQCIRKSDAAKKV